MKKKILASIMCCVMAAALISACGGSTASTTAAPAKTEAAAKAETTKAAATTAAAAMTKAEAATTKAASATTAAAASSKGGKKFGYTYWAASDFFSTIGQTMQDIAKKNGDEVIVVDAQQDQAKQISIIEDFITQGVSAVFLNPVDREGIEPALDMLNKAKIPIINVDTSVKSIDKVNSYIASDNYGAGVLCGKKLIELCPNGGNIAILDYPANSACLDRVQGFTETIKGKNYKIVAQQDAQGKPDPGLAKTQDILQANPDLVAVFGCNDQCGQGAYAAIKEANSKAIVIGVDGSPEGKQYIKEGGAFVATAAQSPKKIGQSAIETAYAILNGKSYEKNIAVPTFIIDKSNVDQYMNGWQ